jgi:hypothetical protein
MDKQAQFVNWFWRTMDDILEEGRQAREAEHMAMIDEMLAASEENTTNE